MSAPKAIETPRDTNIRFFSEIFGAIIGWKKFLTKMPAFRLRPESTELMVAANMAAINKPTIPAGIYNFTKAI